MHKKSLALALAAMGGFLFSSAYAEPLRCTPAVLQAPGDPAAGAIQYQVQCATASPSDLAPAVLFSGALTTKGEGPYDVQATYLIKTQGESAIRLQQLPREDQVATGEMKTSVVSAAALPSQFSAQTNWDAGSGALSIEAAPGTWRVYSANYKESPEEPGLIEAGQASAPVVNGKAEHKVVLGSKYSRFAGKAGAALPVVTAVMLLRDGKLEVQLGETRVANQSALQGALLSLDRQPKDVMRAWAFAARAQFLGLSDEVRYAEQKVAAHHPDLLEEFQLSVARIKPHSVTN